MTAPVLFEISGVLGANCIYVKAISQTPITPTTKLLFMIVIYLDREDILSGNVNSSSQALLS